MFTCPFASRGAGCFDGVFAPSIIHCPLLGGPTFPHRCRACFLVSCSGFTWIHICIVGQRKERNRLVRSLKKGQGWSSVLLLSHWPGPVEAAKEKQGNEV